jgi:hypothetical protein
MLLWQAIKQPPRNIQGGCHYCRELLIGAFELAQQFVSAPGRVIEALGSGFTAIPDGFQFFVYDITNLNEITKTKTPGIRGWLVQAKLLDGGVGPRIVGVKPLFPG